MAAYFENRAVTYYEVVHDLAPRPSNTGGVCFQRNDFNNIPFDNSPRLDLVIFYALNFAVTTGLDLIRNNLFQRRLSLGLSWLHFK